MVNDADNSFSIIIHRYEFPFIIFSLLYAYFVSFVHNEHIHVFGALRLVASAHLASNDYTGKTSSSAAYNGLSESQLYQNMFLQRIWQIHYDEHEPIYTFFIC